MLLGFDAPEVPSHLPPFRSDLIQPVGGVDSLSFFLASLAKHRAVFSGCPEVFLEKKIPGKNGEGSPRMRADQDVEDPTWWT